MLATTFLFFNWISNEMLIPSFDVSVSMHQGNKVSVFEGKLGQQ